MNTVLPLTSSQVDTEAEIDALIISPVNTRAAHTLREKAVRNGIPFISESTQEIGALYLGCRNYEAGYTLGQWAYQYILKHFDEAPVVLDISQNSLENTRERSIGFIDGL
ncbi:MAG: hypothetical protein AAF125_15065, partial [Chloroflexota bacterium]